MAVEWTLEAGEVVALPLDDLALRVLRDARDNDEWNSHNWILLAAKGGYRDRPDAVRALAEAWAWLRNRNLIARNPDQSAPDSFFITRRGHEVLDRGLRWLRAVERLDIQLTPELELRARPQFLRGDFEAAAFMAMKEVEVAVRALAGLRTRCLARVSCRKRLRNPRILTIQLPPVPSGNPIPTPVRRSR